MEPLLSTLPPSAGLPDNEDVAETVSTSSTRVKALYCGSPAWMLVMKEIYMGDKRTWSV
jgi:hypothetical protein